MIVPVTSLAHYRAHLEPVLALLPHATERRAHDDVALVASHRDLRTARQAGFRRIVLAQHGIGQSYSGDHPSYPGGRDNGDVGLFLVPNEHSAGRWRRAYPSASVAIVGSPILDGLPQRDGGGGPPVVAIAFNWNCGVAPESRSARHEYRGVLADLTAHYRVIGHGHPRIPNLARFWRQRAIEYVPDFREVCRRADVLIADNTSALYEFASTGRPVGLLNSRHYRRSEQHGLRFWDAAHVGPSIDEPRMLRALVMAALDDDHEAKARREDALSIVYAYRSGAAERAAQAIMEWAGLGQTVAA